MYLAKYQDFNVDCEEIPGRSSKSDVLSTPEEVIAWIVTSCKGDGSDLRFLGKGCFRELYGDGDYRDFTTYELNQVSIEVSVTKID